jgi:S-phase kinase-associated protein 1
MAEPETVTLTSQEGEKFKVTRRVAALSNLCNTMLEGTEESEEINCPLPNVKSEILVKVIDFLKHHVDSPMVDIDKPLKSANMAEVVADDWDAKYTDQPQDIIFELILASNYMDIKSLLDLTCAKVASMIKGKTPEEIRRTFNIVNDFTPEEEAQVREENKWCEDS